MIVNRLVEMARHDETQTSYRLQEIAWLATPKARTVSNKMVQHFCKTVQRADAPINKCEAF